MPSYDGIMKQKYYDGTSVIINLSTEIGELLGIVDATYLRKPTTELRKANQIKSIQSSLWIEGNTLTEQQVSDIIDDKRVLGSAKDIKEVKNAIDVYTNLQSFSCTNIRSYKSAHKRLMNGLVDDPGKFRTQGVGVFKGAKIAHLAPPVWNVDHLMMELFDYLKTSEDNMIIKSCVFHYEMEFIHPFMDGNGRMGRLWQTIILMQKNSVFEFLPIEHEIKSAQLDYYEALASSDKQGVCTIFVTYMLKIIKKSLQTLIAQQRVSLSDNERLQYFVDNCKLREFSRKDYLNMFKSISSATATRDMKKGIAEGLWRKLGENRTTRYLIRK